MSDLNNLGFQVVTVILILYSVYHITELALGPEGPLFQSEAAFMIMEGVLPLLCCLFMALFHPGVAFGWALPSAAAAETRCGREPAVTADKRGCPMHHRYDPNIRKQLSPALQATARSSYIPDAVSSSNGLPSNPRPAYKASSPLIPSPTSVQTSSSRQPSTRSERRGHSHKGLVNNDSLW